MGAKIQVLFIVPHHILAQISTILPAITQYHRNVPGTDRASPYSQKKRQAHGLFRSSDLTLIFAGILLQKKMDSAAGAFVFPTRFVHYKYNT